ncbi:LysR family transcriptional regulator [Rugosimonospora africana]|uniref:LysR family transcriptional regulator n=1 Tax=Rugosimonospora africana TaxID=556532 RepID=A0A8J3VT42_9ACTN|nr:LysR family transcriptional regulator [Rugosimonospora africana]GIH17128.1 LysR family transcriptional regulator [Rugosimonospora africana]
MFDVRLLQTLVAVAEHKSFVRAAQALHATQPGVSQQIARLEAHLGVRLFTRGAGPVELTPSGAQVLARARHILAAVARLESEAEAWAGGYAGAISVGLSTSVLASALPSLLREFRQRRPEFRLSITVRPADELFPQLDLGALDAILTTLPADSSEYLCHRVAVQRLGIAVPADHPVAQRASVGIDEVFDERFIVVPRTQHRAIHDKLIARFESAGRVLDIAGEEVGFPSVLARIGLGEGVGLVPTGLSTPGTGVVVVPLDEEDFVLPICYVVRRDADSAAVRVLFEEIAAAAEAARGGGGVPATLSTPSPAPSPTPGPAPSPTPSCRAARHDH